MWIFRQQLQMQEAIRLFVQLLHLYPPTILQQAWEYGPLFLVLQPLQIPIPQTQLSPDLQTDHLIHSAGQFPMEHALHPKMM